MGDDAFEHFEKIAMKRFNYEQRVIVLEAKRARKSEDKLKDKNNALQMDLNEAIAGEEKLEKENANLRKSALVRLTIEQHEVIKSLRKENAELKKELEMVRDTIAYKNLQEKRKPPIVQEI